MTPASRRRTRLTAAVAVLVASVAGLAVLAWEWRHPDELVNNGSTGMYARVGEVGWLGAGLLPSGAAVDSVTIHAAEPQVAAGQADVQVWVCHLEPGDEGVGAVRGSLDRSCSSHEPAAGARLAGDDQLLLRITAEEPTRVVVRGIDVTYSAGWRRGTQRVGHRDLMVFGTETLRERGSDWRRP